MATTTTAREKNRAIKAETLRLFELRYAGDDPARRGAWLEARKRIVGLNRGLAINYAREHPSKFLAFDDLVGHGVLGLFEACEVYEPARGAFSTCALLYVRKHVNLGIAADGRTISLPYNMHPVVCKVTTGAMDPADVASDFASCLDDAIRASRCRGRGWEPEMGRPLAAPWGKIADRDDAPWARMELAEDIARLSAAMEACLSDRERAVVRHRYGLGGSPAETWATIGDRLGICGENVRKIEGVAMGRIRSYFETGQVPPRSHQWRLANERRAS